MFKRYALFAGDTYYPHGGISDLVGVYDTEAEAQAAFDAGARPNGYQFGKDWYQIVDLWELIARS